MTALHHSLPNRLAEVRQIAGISQAALAKPLGVSASLVSHWESGSRVPSGDQLAGLARQLGVSLDYLLNAEIRPNFKCRAVATPDPHQSPAVDRTLVDASMQVHYVSAALKRARKLPKPFGLMADFPAGSELPNIAANFRATLKLNTRVNLEEFKQALSEWGVFVFDWRMPWHLSGLSYRGAFTAIFINYEHPPTRRLFTLAHEFAHVLFHLGRKPSDGGDVAVSIASNRDPEEKEANAFAGEFLLPTVELDQLVRGLGRSRLREQSVLAAIARDFNVSRDALFYRLTQQKVFRWPERKDYFSNTFKAPDPPAHHITAGSDLAQQVDTRFLRLALKLLQADQITTGKLAEWLFAPRHVLDEYLLKLNADEEIDMAIGDGNNHVEEDDDSGD